VHCNAHGANPQCVFLAVIGDAVAPRRPEIGKQCVVARECFRRSRFIGATDQCLYGLVGELREIGLAIGRAVERERVTDGRDGAKPLRSDHLVDEDKVVLFHRGKIDSLVQFFRQAFKKWSCHRDEITAHRGREPQDRRPEPHAAVWRRRNDQFFRFQRGNDALHGRARKVHALCDLTQAQSAVFLFQRTQDRGCPRDHLHLALVVGHQTIHDATHTTHRQSYAALHRGTR
jgi:hypothetical protein